MGKARDEALNALRYTGSVSFAGRSTGWATRERLVIYVFFPFSIVLFLGAATVPFVEATTRLEVLKAVGYLLATALFLAIMTSYLVTGWKHRRVQRQPVLIDARGLTLCGHGPIPWDGLQPAERRKVRLAKVEDPVTRDVIWLTRQGTEFIHGQLTEKQRKLLVPDHASDWVSFLFVPGVKGLKAREFMEVYNAAHQRYARA